MKRRGEETDVVPRPPEDRSGGNGRGHEAELLGLAVEQLCNCGHGLVSVSSSMGRQEEEGMRAKTHPILIRPVEEEREHLVTEQTKRTGRDPVVRNTHERDEVENACTFTSRNISLHFFERGKGRRGRTEPPPPSLPLHTLQCSERESGRERSGVDGGSEGDEEGEFLSEFRNHALSCAKRTESALGENMREGQMYRENRTWWRFLASGR
jgi:hypothetical protein